MIVEDKVAVGHNRALQPSGYGGHFLILVSLIFFVVTYFSLSPFGKIRQFFEGKTVIRKKTNSKVKKSNKRS
jgi:hypothetical protein